VAADESVGISDKKGFGVHAAAGCKHLGLVVGQAVFTEGFGPGHIHTSWL
jgi:hypothetical protein